MDKLQLERINQRNPFLSVNEAVYQMVRREILLLRIRPGARIRVSNISELLHVSRTPVKQAFERLYQEKLLKKREGKSGYFVMQMSRGSLEDLFYTRKIIEGNATYLCALHPRDLDLARLKSVAEEFEQIFLTGNYEKLSKVDCLFHQLLVDGSQNAYMQSMYRSLRDPILYLSMRTQDELVRGHISELPSNFAMQHLSIYHAVEMAIPHLALQTAYSHIDSCVDFVRRNYQGY